MNEVKLTGDLTWHKLLAYLDAEIQSLRELNDDVSLDQVKTAALRGKIQSLKNLRDLPTSEAHKRAIRQLALPGSED